MDIAALYVDDGAHVATSRSSERGKVETVVAAVFEHGAVTAGALGGVHECPTLGERHGCRHFNGYMLAAVHRFEGNGRVRGPVGADINEVEVVAATKVLVVGEGCWVLGDFLHHRLQALFRNIAESGDFGMFYLQKSLHGLLTALAESDDADAHER